MAVAATVVAAAYGAYSQYQAGEDQKKAARAQKDLANKNAKLLDEQADDATARGNEEAMLINRRARGLRGQQRASLAGQGVDVGTGTAADLQNETTLLGGLDADQTRKNAFREAWGIRGKASNERLAGEYNYRENMNKAKAYRNQAYGSALGGAAAGYDSWYSNSHPKVTTA